MGNEYKVADLSQLTRENLRKKVDKVEPSAPKKEGSISGVTPVQVTKFGTQAQTAKKITVYLNGDKNHKGVTITLSKSINSFKKLLAEITKKLTFSTGAAQRIYEAIGDEEKPFKLIKELDDMIDGSRYLACGPEKIAHDRMPPIFARDDDLDPI